jgi:hypothetical protein
MVIFAPLSLVDAHDHPRLTLQNLRAKVLFQPISPQTDFFQGGVNKTRARQFAM